MRALAMVVALFLGFTVVGPTQGQTSSLGRPAISLGSFDPRPIQFQPVDMSRVMAPLPQQQQPPFSLSNLFSWAHLPSWPPSFSTSPLPAPSSFPSTHYPSQFQPLLPIPAPAQ